MRAAIGLVNPLDDFLAPLMLEIDVNIGGLAPFGRDEAFEQQLGAHRVDRGDPENIADRAVRRRAAALAENLARSEEHTSELQALMRNSNAVFCLKKQHNITTLSYDYHYQMKSLS